jgi:phospholipase C
MHFALLCMAAFIAAIAAPTTSLAATTNPATTLGIRYVVVVVMENRGYDQIVGSPSAPYLNSLISRYGLATDYDGVAHPSEPNYLALLGGSTFGISDDNVHNIAVTSLLDQLSSKGLTWRVAAEDVPGHCYAGATAYGGTDGPGWYARKHEPAISFTNIRTNAASCANIENLGAFRPGAATFQLVVPNFCHDMHDCSTGTGDAFLRSWLPRILTSATFAQTLLVVTWDEGTDNAGGGGHVATLAISPSVRAGARLASRTSHYSILRSVEDLWGLPCLRNACGARDLLAFLHAS